MPAPTLPPGPTSRGMSSDSQPWFLGCCPTCCAPCGALLYLDREGVLDALLAEWAEGIRDDEAFPGGKVDRQWMYRQWCGSQMQEQCGHRIETPAGITAAPAPLADRYVMATTAHHQLGDLSRDEPNLAIIYGETDTDWIGEWATGVGLVNVRFPKATTRELNDAERQQYSGKFIETAGMARPIRIEAPGEMSAARLTDAQILDYYDRHQAHLVADLPDDGREHLRRTYLDGVRQNPRAAQQIAAILADEATP